MADAVKAVRQGVQEEAPDELVGVERHGLRPAVMPIILPTERDPIVGHADQSGIGDRDAMGVATEIGQHLLRPAEGRLGIDDPFEAADLGKLAVERSGRRQFGEMLKKLNLPASYAVRSSSRKSRRNRRDRTRTGRKKPGLQEIQCVPSGDSPPPGTMQWM